MLRLRRWTTRFAHLLLLPVVVVARRPFVAWHTLRARRNTQALPARRRLDPNDRLERRAGAPDPLPLSTIELHELMNTDVVRSSASADLAEAQVALVPRCARCGRRVINQAAAKDKRGRLLHASCL
jgi:hypothetical protein